MGDEWSVLRYRYNFLLAIGDVPDGYGFGEERSKTMLLCGMNSREKTAIGLRVAQQEHRLAIGAFGFFAIGFPVAHSVVGINELLTQFFRLTKGGYRGGWRDRSEHAGSDERRAACG